jgi:hypothetical protein
MRGSFVTEDADDEYCFKLLVRIKHPTVSLTDMTHALDRETAHAWSVGDPGPAGASFQFRRYTYWLTSRAVLDTRFFSRDLEIDLTWLQSKRDFVRSLLDTGGSVSLEVWLPGQINIGDVLTPVLLGKMAELGVGLGIEVLPHLDAELRKGSAR